MSRKHVRRRNAAADLSVAGLPAGRKYLVGVSGGRDSMALLHALVKSGFRKLIICHLNHQLRGADSDGDARFVERNAKRLGIPCEIGVAGVANHAASMKVSVETAARDLRREFFAACARDHKCNRVILAHHADDQVETCLFNFLRGAGAVGIAGMKMASQHGSISFLRPWLGIRRRAIDAYVRANRIAYREDRSNTERLATRNRLRHDVLPIVEEIFGISFADAVLRAAEILRAEEEWMDSQVPASGATLCCKELRASPLALQRRIVLGWLRDQGIFEPGFDETERVLSLLDPVKGPAKINLPRDRHARRRAGVIFLE